MKRKLILGERIMHVDRTTPLNCILAVKINGRMDIDSLQTALFKIQQKHSLLRMKIEENDHEPYFVIDEHIGEIPIAVVPRTSEDQWISESKKQWFEPFTGTLLPMARLVWIKGEPVSELLLALPHSVCDGTTIVNLMRELLRLTNDKTEELTSYPIFEKIEDLFPENRKTSEHVFKRKLFSLLAKGYFLLKTSKTKFNEQDNYVLHWKVNEEISEGFRLKCKAEKTSVHAALCAIFLTAFKQVKGNIANGKAISPVDIRHYLPAIKPDMMFAFAPIVELNLSDKEKNVWEAARKIKNELVKKMDALKICDLLTTSEYFHSSVAKMIDFLKSTRGSHDVTFSNLGRINIPQKYNHFEVAAIYSPTAAFPWRNANTLITSYYQHQLDFSFLSRESFLSEFEAERIKAAAMKLITDHVTEPSYV